MQKINRSTGTPMGMAFVFLFLTAIPVTLRAVGINVSFSLRPGAVTDAWKQIAGVFTNDYQTGNSSELIAVNKPASCDETLEKADLRLIARLDLSESDQLLESASNESKSNYVAVERNESASTEAASRNREVMKRARKGVVTKARERRMDFVFQNVQIARELKPLIDDKEIRERVSWQLKLRERELEKAFKVLKLNEGARVVVSLPGGVSSKCGEKRALPARPETDFVWRTAPARVPSPSAPAAEKSEI